jgi:hypothetical protein
MKVNQKMEKMMIRDTVSTPMMDAPVMGEKMQRLNSFLDRRVLPYPVKYLTNRLTIIATLCLLIPLIAFANTQVFVLAANSYLNVMSVVVSSTVLLYSTIAEVRDRAAAKRREEIAQQHEAVLDMQIQSNHDLLLKIQDELAQHINERLDTIQHILLERLTQIEINEDAQDKALHQEVLATIAAHKQELTDLNQMVKGMMS